MRINLRHKTLLGTILLFFLAAVFLNASEAWYRRIEIDAFERIAGQGRIEPSDAAVTNSYQFRYDAAGRLVELEYHRSGRSLADPVYGVPRIEISYEPGYVHWRFTDSRGNPISNEQGIWSKRIRLDDSGRAVGGFNYDRFGNLIADRFGVALRLWDLDKFGRRWNERFFDASGARIEDVRGVSEIHYRWDDADRLISRRYYSMESEAVTASDLGVHGYLFARDENGEV